MALEITAVCPELPGILSRARPNVVLIGPEAATAAAVEQIRSYLRAPVEAWSPLDARALPDKPGTLLVPAIDALDADRQSQLYAWLDTRFGRVQVVALSATPLFSLLKRGVFHARLYYRLNQLYVDLTGAAEG